MTRRLALAAALAVLAGFAAYAPALKAGFLWDGREIQAEALPSMTVANAFLPRGGTVTPVYYNRPLMQLSFMADDALNRAFAGDPDKAPGGRLDPAFAPIPHTVTLLFHLLSTALVVLFAFRLFREPLGDSAHLGAGAAGLLFALHPAHAESVILIAGRTDSMATAFLLAALLAALPFRDRPGVVTGAASGLLFLCALWSKEVALAGLALLPLTLLAVKTPKDSGGRRIRALALLPFAAAALVYLALRLGAGFGGGAARETSLPAGLYDLAAAFSWSLRNLLAPWPVTPFAPDLPGIAETALILLLFAAAAYLSFRAFRRGKPLFAFALAFVCAAAAPSLAVAVRQMADAPVAQRYLYLPSVGLALAGGYLLASWNRRWAAALVVGALLAPSAALTLNAAFKWRTPEGLWRDVLTHEAIARHPLPWLNLGQALLAAPETLDGAEEAYGRALTTPVAPDGEDRALARHGLGAIAANRAQLAYRAGRFGEAMASLRRAGEEYDLAVAEKAADYPVIFRSRGEARLMLAFLKFGTERRWDGNLLARAGEDLTLAARLMPGDAHTGGLLARWRSYSGR